MTVKTFDVQKGFYAFETDQLQTALHAHPALEVLWVARGEAHVRALGHSWENVRWAVIDAHVPHQVVTTKGQVHLLMIEGETQPLRAWLTQQGIELEKGVHTSSSEADFAALFQQAVRYGQRQAAVRVVDERVQTCLTYLGSTNAAYHQMLHDLKARVHLSESRLAHLFKAQVGISMKQYLVWSKLKRAIELVLNEQIHLYEAALRVGFYDQAHFTKAFKKYLGSTPSAYYNSRTIQV